MNDLRFFQKWAEGLIPGGEAEEKNLQPAQVDQEELAEGIEHELEHANSVDIAKEIAMDHLAEMPDYYTKLEEMEEEAEEEKPAPTPQDVAGFLAQSADAPDDEAFHAWAEQQGFDTEQAEAAAYQLAKEKADEMKTAGAIADRILKKMYGEGKSQEGMVGVEESGKGIHQGIEKIESKIAPVPETKTASEIADIVLRTAR